MGFFSSDESSAVGMATACPVGAWGADSGGGALLGPPPEPLIRLMVSIVDKDTSRFTSEGVWPK